METFETSLLNDVVEITRENNEQYVNEKLSKGWILLKIFTTASELEADQTVHYVLGKLAKKDDPFEKLMD